MGISGGIFNLCGNLASIVTPIVIGIIVKELGSFDMALAYVGALGLVGALSHLVIVGPLKRLELGETSGS
jgi:ACS family glucarate transporter-like MFS transporter